jgi:hypothetical protein
MACCMSEHHVGGCNEASNRSEATLRMMLEESAIEERESQGDNRRHLFGRDSLLRVGP